MENKTNRLDDLTSKKWYIVNAENQTLGRLSTRIADVLRGKTKPSYVPYLDLGDYVIVTNAEKIKVTGAKEDKKIYYRHSTYPGGLKQRTFKEQMEKDPRKVIIHAVKGMIPKNKLGDAVIKKLYVYTGTEHKHNAQKPIEMKS